MRAQIRETTNTTRKMKKRSLAISADPVAMPPNPKTAAMIAMMKNATAQRSMDPPFAVSGTGGSSQTPPERLPGAPAGRSPMVGRVMDRLRGMGCDPRGPFSVKSDPLHVVHGGVKGAGTPVPATETVD